MNKDNDEELKKELTLKVLEFYKGQGPDPALVERLLHILYRYVKSFTL